MFVLQCNFKEYVENDHDGNYNWYRLCVDNDVEKDFAVGFNIQRFKNHEAEITSIISKIKEIWKQSCGVQVDLLNSITNVAALKKDDYEMIVSVHFWFDKSVIDDGIEDTQYMKIVYTCFSTDVIHEGHLNIINEAQKYGEVVIGALTDEVLVRFSRFPTVPQDSRIKLYESIKGVSRVVLQDDIYYDKVFENLCPDYVIHGDNWNKTERATKVKKNVLELLSKNHGELIEVPYTKNHNVQKIDRQLVEKLSMPEYRRSRLKQLIQLRPIVKMIEAHSGLTGLIAEKTVIEVDGGFDQFDGMWVSSLCDSLDKGKPDIELVDMSSRLRTIDDITDVTTKPIILDGDTGGITEHFVYNIRTLERKGISAVIIEDKTGLKRNSLFGTEVEQTQDTIENFCEKIRAGKQAQLTDDFMIIARIESLILEKGMKDALNRAEAYVHAGADGIMIHSRKKEPDEIFEFCDKFREKDKDTPLVVVPTSFNSVTEKELASHGINIVIYANQLMRAAFPAMKKTAEMILKNHRAKEADNLLMPVKEIINLIDEI